MNPSKTGPRAWLIGLGLFAAAAFCQIAQAEPAQAFPAKVSVGTDTLQLNGRGVRARLLVKVYEAGLYTKKPVQSIDELAKLDGPKRLHAVAMREVDAETVGRFFIKGFTENNSRDDVAKMLPTLSQLSVLFTDKRKIKTGDSFGFDYVPGLGTKLVINGAIQGDWVKDPAFFPMVMRIWMGPQPADADLKQALLGLPPLRMQVAAVEP
jgi:hypothetical protein